MWRGWECCECEVGGCQARLVGFCGQLFSCFSLLFFFPVFLTPDHWWELRRGQLCWIWIWFFNWNRCQLGTNIRLMTNTIAIGNKINDSVNTYESWKRRIFCQRKPVWLKELDIGRKLLDHFSVRVYLPRARTFSVPALKWLATFLLWGDTGDFWIS